MHTAAVPSRTCLSPYPHVPIPPYPYPPHGTAPHTTTLSSTHAHTHTHTYTHTYTQVLNGASDLFIEIFGEAGRHSRSAVGVNVLPMNVCVEVEAIFELDASKF